MATQWKKILRISELYQKKNQLYPYANGFFLEFYLQINIAMSNHSERTQKFLLSVKLIAFKFLHPSTIRQTKTSKKSRLKYHVKIQIRLHKSSAKLFFQRDLVQSI